ILAFQDDAAGSRLQCAGQKVDERRLAGTVRPDQRMARPALHRQRDIIGGQEAAELLHEVAGFEDGAHRSLRSFTPGRQSAILLRFSRTEAGRNVCQRPRFSRPTMTIATSTRPIQKSQYCGVSTDSQARNMVKRMAPTMPP